MMTINVPRMVVHLLEDALTIVLNAMIRICVQRTLVIRILDVFLHQFLMMIMTNVLMILAAQNLVFNTLLFPAMIMMLVLPILVIQLLDVNMMMLYVMIMTIVPSTIVVNLLDAGLNL
jgi:hypothetical protein